MRVRVPSVAYGENMIWQFIRLIAAIIATIGIVLILLWTEDAVGQETPHPSNLCDYQYAFQPDLLPHLNDPKLFKQEINFGGFTYFFYINKKTEKVEVVIATNFNLITGEKTENWTWQDEEVIFSTVPKYKWNICVIMMKKIKASRLHPEKKFDLTGLRDRMLEVLKKENQNGN